MPRSSSWLRTTTPRRSAGRILPLHRGQKFCRNPLQNEFGAWGPGDRKQPTGWRPQESRRHPTPHCSIGLEVELCLDLPLTVRSRELVVNLAEVRGINIGARPADLGAIERVEV